MLVFPVERNRHPVTAVQVIILEQIPLDPPNLVPAYRLDPIAPDHSHDLQKTILADNQSPASRLPNFQPINNPTLKNGIQTGRQTGEKQIRLTPGLFESHSKSHTQREQPEANNKQANDTQKEDKPWLQLVDTQRCSKPVHQ